MRPGSVLILVLLAATGCDSQSARWEDVDWELEETVAGQYGGDLTVQARAKVGPVVVRNQTCSAPAFLWLNPDRVATGTLSCDFGGDIGTLSLDLDGASFALPLIGGTLSADLDGEPMEVDWNGGFTSDQSFFGETEGRRTMEGITVVFNGWFDVSRVDQAQPM